MKKGYFTRFEKGLWLGSVLAVLLSFFLSGEEQYMTLAASLIGVTSLIFAAKRNPFGMLLMIVFSILYGMISYRAAYYGEMVTYLGMTLPMSVFSFVAWLRHPQGGKHSVVEIGRLTGWDRVLLCVLTIIVTAAFYYVLAYFHTANLIPSTLSVSTSFAAAYLTFRRNPYYAAAYALNDIILIVLWCMMKDMPVVICFVVFLVNDLYGFLSWKRDENQDMT